MCWRTIFIVRRLSHIRLDDHIDNEDITFLFYFNILCDYMIVSLLIVIQDTSSCSRNPYFI
jgi:hypothetical protein